MNVLISAWQPLTFPALLTVRTVRIESFMPLIRFFQRFACLLLVLARTLFQRLGRKPATAMHLSGTGADLVRGKQKLIVENVLLRHQLIVLRRSVARPSITATGRALLLLRAGHLRAWRPVLVIVQPDTPRRHRQGFRLFRRWKSRAKVGWPPLPAATVALLKEMAANNLHWGAERIRGELLKLGIRVS